jgi:hypothetical protein
VSILLWAICVWFLYVCVRALFVAIAEIARALFPPMPTPPLKQIRLDLSKFHFPELNPDPPPAPWP